MSTIKTVHVVFKTHLDIGFTELGKTVLDTYVTSFIPKAIELAEQMNGRFIWTTGSFLIDYYLGHADDEARARMEAAIRNGYIVWHGLPFTTHTEAVESKLFDYGLSISKKLDDKYHRNTIAAKMTDVPGHTIAIVSKLASHGIKYLHLGVNPASTVPGVPPVFVWQDESGSDIIVNYHDSYGDALVIDDFEDALVFAHTMDNHGPQTRDEVNQICDRLQKRFPGAEVVASTLDAFSRKLLKIKDALPVVQEEIGDTWIHGIASDPLKISRYRALVRLRDEWLHEGRMAEDTEEYASFSQALLLVPEHTWGVDTKRFLPDYVSWSKEEFRAARQQDVIPEVRVPEVYAYLENHALRDAREKWRYSYLESSWAEQNGYITDAIQALSKDKQIEASVRLQQTQAEPNLPTGDAIQTDKMYKLGLFDVVFSHDGSIKFLRDDRGKVWADDDHNLFTYSYQTFSHQNYQHWFDRYNVKMKQNYTWAVGDFGKPGFEFVSPKPRNHFYKPVTRKMDFLRRENATDVVSCELTMPNRATEDCGAPRRIVLEYRFHKNVIDVTLWWLDKDAVRLPEASWLSFVPIVENPNRWQVDKLGQWVSPWNVVKGGNRSMHALETGVRYQGADGNILVESFDAPLVAFGEPRLLQYEDTFANPSGGLHFNLHNNVWGTNFRMWFEGNMRFHYRISLESY